MIRSATLLVFVALAAAAQEPLFRPADRPQKPGRIEGAVVSTADGSPLRRARVVLQSLEAGGSSVAVEVDEKGAFAIPDVTPGEYRISARRDGYLESSIAYHHGLRLPGNFAVEPDQRITDVVLKLTPWAVLSGRVRYDDGEPAIGVRVELYREVRTRGRSQFRLAATGSTNDRGEYRIYGLPPAAYFAAAAVERDLGGADTSRVTGYSTTFYPGTFKLSEAVPIQLGAGREFGNLDLMLKSVRKVRVRGRVTNGVTGEVIRPSALLLERMDAHNDGSLPTAVPATFDRNLNFEIRGVVAGSYNLWAEASERGGRLIARRPITVGDEDVENADLIAEPEISVTITMRLEGGGMLPVDFGWRLILQPRSERGMIVDAQPRRGTDYQVMLMPEETYDVFLPNTPADMFLAGVRVGGTDVRAQGLKGEQAAQQTVELVLDSHGGQIAGRAFSPQGEAMSGARIELIPDPAEGHLQDYREVYADEYGQFQIRGIAPGNYILIAWLDDPPCDIYNTSDLSDCRAVGTSLKVGASSQQTLELDMKARP
jgi:hypothetical protein